MLVVALDCVTHSGINGNGGLCLLRRHQHYQLRDREIHSPAGSELIQDKSISDARFVCGVSDLKRHQLAVGRDDRIRSLPPFIVVKVSEPDKVLARAVELQLVNINIARSMLAT